MSRSVTISGGPELTAALIAASAAAHAAVVRAVADEVKDVEEDAREGAPVRSGALRDAIRGRSSGAFGGVKSTARHAWFVEGGTYKDKAQPYMHPAAEKSRARFPKRVASLVGLALGGK